MAAFAARKASTGIFTGGEAKIPAASDAVSHSSDGTTESLSAEQVLHSDKPDTWSQYPLFRPSHGRTWQGIRKSSVTVTVRNTSPLLRCGQAQPGQNACGHTLANPRKLDEGTDLLEELEVRSQQH
jgi:hypothetical protein